MVTAAVLDPESVERVGGRTLAELRASPVRLARAIADAARLDGHEAVLVDLRAFELAADGLLAVLAPVAGLAPELRVGVVLPPAFPEEGLRGLLDGGVRLVGVREPPSGVTANLLEFFRCETVPV